MYRYGSVQQKILLVLLGGVALGLSSSSRQYFKNLRTIRKDWRNIDQRNFNRSIKRLSKEKLVEERKLADGSIKLVLTAKGKQQAKALDLLGNTIRLRKPKKWDKKWRLVLFDIPEKDRIFRGILREHLYELKFFKLQHSVFVSPYPYEKAILDLVKLYRAEPYVRVAMATGIDNEKKIRNHFFK